MNGTKDPRTYDPVGLSQDLLEASDALDQLQDTVVARRRSLEAAGFSPAVAEHMAAAMWIGAFTNGTSA